MSKRLDFFREIMYLILYEVIVERNHVNQKKTRFINAP